MKGHRRQRPALGHQPRIVSFEIAAQHCTEEEQVSRQIIQGATAMSPNRLHFLQGLKRAH